MDHRLDRVRMPARGIRLSDAQYARLRQLAAATHRLPSQLVRLLIDRAEVGGGGEIRLRPLGEGGDRP
jgi:hypothetical protein